jgi:hypothetical protein
MYIFVCTRAPLLLLLLLLLRDKNYIYVYYYDAPRPTERDGEINGWKKNRSDFLPEEYTTKIRLRREGVHE